MFRGTPQMFASDSVALALALDMAKNMSELKPVEKLFIYLAIMHAESLEYSQMGVRGLKAIVAVDMADQYGEVKYRRLIPSAKAHVDKLERFGRYCHRNEILGRESTPEEKKFLVTAGQTFIRSVMGPEALVATPERTKCGNPAGPTYVSY